MPTKQTPERKADEPKYRIVQRAKYDYVVEVLTIDKFFGWEFGRMYIPFQIPKPVGGMKTEVHKTEDAARFRINMLIKQDEFREQERKEAYPKIINY